MVTLRELREVEGDETMVTMYCMREEYVFNKKKEVMQK